MQDPDAKSTVPSGSPPTTPPKNSPTSTSSAVATSIGAVTAPLDQATRPSLTQNSTAVSQLSVTAQAPGTPQSQLSTSVPSSTPVPNVPTEPISDGITPPRSVSPWAATPIQTVPAPVGAGDPQPDPAVALLKSMFPDFDDMVLQSVLEACDNDQDRAVEMLLGMSDPDYVSSARTPPRQPTQLELDEELARRLFLEYQEEPQLPPAPPQQQRHNLPYQPRQSHPHHYQQQPVRGSDGAYEQHTSGDGQGMGIAGDLRERFTSFLSGGPQAAPRTGARGISPNAGGAHQDGSTGPGAGPDFQDQFNKFAETGKRTFNTIVTKVKAKIQEFENPHGSPEMQQQQQSQQQAGHWSNWQYNPNQPPQGHHDPTSPQQPQPGAFVFREEPAFPNDPSNPRTQRSSTPPTQGATRTGGGAAEYYSAPRPTAASNTATSPTTVPPPHDPMPSLSTKPVPAIPPPESTAAESATPRASFDASRLGLKPKRPVSFVDTSNTHNAQHGKQRDNDEESLEYVSSPFDDR